MRVGHYLEKRFLALSVNVALRLKYSSLSYKVNLYSFFGNRNATLMINGMSISLINQIHSGKPNYFMVIDAFFHWIVRHILAWIS